MNVSQILGGKGSEIISVEAGTPLVEVARVLGERRIGAVPVLEGGKLAGIISERDIVRGIAIRGAETLQDAVDSLMTKSVTTCTPHETIVRVMEIMTERRIRHIPVVDDQGLVGMVTIGDVVKARIDETQAEAAALKEYIATG